jgi:hypothetical protein
VQAQLPLDDLEAARGIRPVGRRQVEDVDEQPRPLDVGEEIVADPGSPAGALDQARDVGDDELVIVEVQRSQDGLQRGEGIGGDLRMRAGETTQQRRLAGVGESDQADVGQQLQPQLDPALLARQAPLGEPGGLTRRARKPLVAVSAGTAARHHDPAVGLEQVVTRAVDPDRLRPRRHPDHQRLAGRAVAQRSVALAAALGAVVHPAPEGLKVAQ